MQVEPQREPFAKRDLYGGAMEFVLPNRFMDIRYPNKSAAKNPAQHNPLISPQPTD
jgi:hypothetical protein